MTEQLWQILNEKLPDKLNNYKGEKFIINSSYPYNIDAKTPGNNIEYLIKLIKSIRNLRSELRIEHNHTLKINIPNKNIYTSISNHKKALQSLCNTELTAMPVKNNFPLAVDNNIFNIEVPNALNMSEEISRIESEIDDIKKRVIPLSKRLNSPEFFNNAPEEVVAKEKERLKQQENRISQLGEILKSIS